jgi:hypothetical protein
VRLHHPWRHHASADNLTANISFSGVIELAEKIIVPDREGAVELVNALLGVTIMAVPQAGTSAVITLDMAMGASVSTFTDVSVGRQGGGGPVEWYCT